jgi:hypothetical protein
MVRACLERGVGRSPNQLAGKPPTRLDQNRRPAWRFVIAPLPKTGGKGTSSGGRAGLAAPEILTLSPKEIHAMDRRRFVPSADGLETRTMMSTTAGSGLSFLSGSATTTQQLPITFQQKSLRILNVPKNLRALSPNRFLPVNTVQQIQLGLFQIMGRMGPVSSTALTNYNLAMRKIVFHPTLSPSSANLLNNGFTGALKAAKTPEPGLTTLSTAIRQLTTQFDTASVNPTYLATNDATYILQLANVIGQPMPAPRVPTITRETGHQVKPGVSVTPLSNPDFTGTYEFGTTMRMIDSANGEVVGLATVAKNGQYLVRVSTPLAVGTYHFYMQAVDEAGHVSHSSRLFLVKVVPPRHPTTAVALAQATPKGPLGLSSNKAK